MRKLHIAVLTTLLQTTLIFAEYPDETNGKIPELDAFHKPIFVLWHEAWPAKDIAKLKALFPDIEKAHVSLVSAKLPGILREKKAKWDEKLRHLTGAVEDYRKAVNENNSEGILKAVEEVHMNYEQLVRVVRPALSELDAFHQSLYVLHHYYMPAKNMEQIDATADSLARKMTALNAAELPKRLEARKEQFAKARKNLDESVRAFTKGVHDKSVSEEIARLEGIVHTRYEVLEKVFE